jgi:hypothetical protein
MQARTAELDYTDLRFALTRVPEVLNGTGRDFRLLMLAGYGYMEEVTEEEVAHAVNTANLAPGDIIISAYYDRGIKGAMCVSVSKVLKFVKGGKIPLNLIHLWPLEFPNLAIDPKKLISVEIEDRRE